MLFCLFLFPPRNVFTPQLKLKIKTNLTHELQCRFCHLVNGNSGVLKTNENLGKLKNC